MAKIDQSAENFKTSPLGFLMSVLAKYSAFVERSLASKPDPELDSKNAGAKDALSNIKIELSQNASLKNQVSNEALMMTVMESFPKSEQDAILDVIFEYMGILDEVLGTADKESENGRALINEYYDVSRLGLILNCYLGQFDNDDFFYGTLAHVMETITAYYSENKTEEIIAIIADDETDEETGFESFDIAPFDWVGILADEEGKQILRAIRLGKFSTNFNPDYVI